LDVVTKACAASIMLSTVLTVGPSRFAFAGPNPIPKQCDVWVSVEGATLEPVTFAGTVRSIKVTKDSGSDVVVDDGTKPQTFTVSTTVALPFKVGDQIDVSLRRGGGWHQVYDALIKDHSGKPILIVSGSGADDWADGWTVATGKVVESSQNPNSTEESVNRTHALDFARGKTKTTVLPNKCVAVQDGADRYAVSGSGHSWVGLRPPEGVDYQTFSMIRWP
jgi:hypothetical protein